MFYTDLHVHSKYSRATSRDCDLEHLALYGAKKGLSVISTGDFTHPMWIREIEDKLDYIDKGLFCLKKEIEHEVFKNYPNLVPPKFLLSTEISTIYKKGDKTRKVHHVVFCPHLESAKKFSSKLDAIGNIKSDGRPILGLDSRSLLEILLTTNEDSYIIPAHIWTPWFSVLGSKSGFNSIEECYEDLSSHIFALETGLSSDPYMNWQVSKLDRFYLVSNSDAHSPSKLAREATIFSSFPDYFYIKNALTTGEGYVGTIEFYPEEGKYHFDGHRKCDICLDPIETRKLGGICPVCNKPLTIGVSYRVLELSDRFGDFTPPKTAGKVVSLTPLIEIIAQTLNLRSTAKKVQGEYERLINKFGSELFILQDLDLDELESDSPILKIALNRLRDNKVIKNPGFDGEYGTISLFKEGEVDSFFNLKLGLDIKDNKVIKKDRKNPQPKLKAENIKETQKLKENKEDIYQKEVLDSKNKSLLTAAGPGSGKTRVLVKKIEKTVKDKNIDPKNILAVTFTKKAALELTSRLEKQKIKGVNIHTFHSLCYKILKNHEETLNLADFRIISQKEKELYKKTYKNALDFDDLILQTLKLFNDYPMVLEEYQDKFKFIFIDEYQDIDTNQYNLIKLITKNSSLFAIGDKNQAIYGFRGGSSRFFNSFLEDFEDSKKIELKYNYRSQKNIVDISNSLINSSSQCAYLAPLDKITLYSANSEKNEAEFIVSTIEDLLGGQNFFSIDSNRTKGINDDYIFSDIAILTRTKFQMDSIEKALDRIGVPYANYSDDLLIDDKKIREFLLSLDDNQTLESQINNNIGVFAQSVYEYFLKLAKKVSSNEEFIHEVSFLTLVDTYDKRADRISLMTLHSSKGLEFKCVFIAGVEQELLPFYLAKTQEEIEEEKRLLYVGFTRAKEKLFLSHCKKRFLNSEPKERSKSSFLDGLDKNLIEFIQSSVVYKKTIKQLKLF